ncbi:type II toxin-antitoxin system VapC family toxin [Sphingomonas sp.]|uniref:type II toxin-antitoxin system VapC family toxin n=1 Tax=Sphingomonas sp. TaxID=28214 RepID=UPI002D7F9C16|nr:type II toxin-antitoxin system VapC family toxin [Sphingomonas sp.]HEU0043537.1 type II toxin-antitoxin system VapC family toxin [Sphingomonas sp.]
MRYLLDSNIIIAALRGAHLPLRARMAACDEGDLVTSSIVYAEVALGALRGEAPAIEVLDQFLADVPVLNFDQPAAMSYARLPFERDRYDHLIAGHALALGLAVATANTEDFERLPGVRVENWMR